jgi:hypothetical protein
VIDEVHRLLAAGSGGGVVQSQTRVDRAQLAAAAAEHSARLAELGGPTTKAELLDALRDALALPAYTGSNWDALEEVLAYPEGASAEPTLLVWHDPRRLPSRDAATFVAIVEAAAKARASARDGALVVVVDGLAEDMH